MFKRWIFAAAALFSLLPLSGCTKMVSEVQEKNLTLYASFQPVYWIAQSVAEGAENVDIRRLVQPTADCPRNYALSEWDAALIGEADGLILLGAGFETFETYFIEEVDQGDLVIITLHDDDAENSAEVSPSEDDTSHFEGESPWFFMSIEDTAQLCDSLATQLAYLDPANEAVYAKNAEEMVARLDSLRIGEQAALWELEDCRVASMHEAFPHLAADFGFVIEETIEREPGENFADGEEQIVIERLKAADIDVVLLEAQAPDRLVRDLEAAGLITAQIDTMTTSGTLQGAEALMDAFSRNAQALQGAFSKATDAEVAQ